MGRDKTEWSVLTQSLRNNLLQNGGEFKNRFYGRQCVRNRNRFVFCTVANEPREYAGRSECGRLRSLKHQRVSYAVVRPEFQKKKKEKIFTRKIRAEFCLLSLRECLITNPFVIFTNGVGKRKREEIRSSRGIIRNIYCNNY